MKPASLILALIFALPLEARAEGPSAEDLHWFEQKIRPVLVERCYACHSQAAAALNKLKGGLFVDSAQGLLKGGDSGPAVVPGKSKESLLFKALRYDGYEMPPDGKLSEKVVADFAVWIDRGAADPRKEAGGASDTAKPAIDFAAARKHWAFQPPVRAARPTVRNAQWPQTEIDYFILAKLEAEGLQPVAPATKRELLRRATFDLIGLPPTPEEVEAFGADASPQAFSKVVDRLLASPHYGERWGRHWLDVARYAEDQAHTFGTKPNDSGYRYRDWVVSALNDDMPYDRFVKLQIAADKIDGTSDDKPKPDSLKNIAALGFFGLGAQYYKNSDAAKASADELDDRVDTLSRGFLGLTVSCARCHDHKFDPIPTQDYYSLAGVFQSCTLNNTPLASAEEIATYNAGQTRIRTAESDLKKFVADQKSLASEAEVSRVGKYVEAAWRAHVARRVDAGSKAMPELAKRFELHEPTLNKWVELVDPKSRGKLPALDEMRNLCATSTGGESKPLDVKTMAVPPTVVSAAVSLEQRLQAALAARRAKKSPETPENKELLEAVFGERGIFTPNDGELERRMPTKSKEQWTAAKLEVDAAKKAAPPIYPLAHTIVDAKPVDMKIFIRGNPARTGDLAPRRFLRILAGDAPKAFTEGSGRRELAEEIAAADNPLTSRVIVNRLWQRHFGRGIVNTPSNFGLLGDRPTHPELLDYLAVRLVEQGWSLKAVHREIMLSAVYRLSSVSHAENEQRDADNRMLWRMDRRRLDVEAWRDSLLAVSGRLDRQLGGASTDLGSPTNVRRTVYGKISRHELDGLLRLFDFPDANITSDTRSETTVPQQQLFVLNSPFMVEQAKAFAARLTKETSTDGSQKAGPRQGDALRVRRAFQLAYGREADEAEVTAAVAYLAASDSPDDAKKNKLNRWERLAQALLSANEFMYID
ncbi:MAG: PSD1 and planctomycete cytochrome C domain-containing protein [Planctomycetia bacterium]|nr:PSD1 and planctomycete cytochrome C domain-containing protein [Planctomycetia bacterium]